MIKLLTHPVILECLDRGLTLEVSKNEIKLNGFYKSGSAVLIIEGGQLVAKMRYNETKIIHSFRDLVELNYEWWEEFKSRWEGWRIPEHPWAEFMVEFGLVEKSVMQIIEYNSVKRSK